MLPNLNRTWAGNQKESKRTPHSISQKRKNLLVTKNSAEEKEAADNGQVSYYRKEEGYCPARFTSKKEREKGKNP